MKKAELPDYFSSLNRGNVTLYVRKNYEERMSSRDIDKLFHLCKDKDVLSAGEKGRRVVSPYRGRSHCRTLLMDSFGAESFVVREYWHGGLFGRLLRDLFWDSIRPIRELLICESAIKGGVKTAEVIAIVRNRIIGPLCKCVLVTREIAKSTDLIEMFLHHEDNQLLKQKRQIIIKLAKAVKDMHDVGICHADLHLKNILVRSDGGCVDVYIIDLDKSKQYGKITLQKRMQNIMRLDRSLEKFRRNVRENLHILLQMTYVTSSLDKEYRNRIAGQITNIDRVRFLREYVRLCFGSQDHSFRSQKEFLKHCLMHYRTTHKSHRFWWYMASGKFIV